MTTAPIRFAVADAHSRSRGPFADTVHNLFISIRDHHHDTSYQEGNLEPARAGPVLYRQAALLAPVPVS